MLGALVSVVAASVSGLGPSGALLLSAFIGFASS
jgi:hypothetical protein